MLSIKWGIFKDVKHLEMKSLENPHAIWLDEKKEEN